MPSKIEYVDETWNPVTGCTKVSPGCQNCYAERMARRLAGRFGYPEAPNHFDVTLHPDRRTRPLEWRRDARILLPSMGDLFHEDVPDDYITSVLGITATSSGPFYTHTYLLLTKRPKRMREYAEAHENLWSVCRIWPMVTVENADCLWRLEELRRTPALKRGVSIEPMLGAVDLMPSLMCHVCHGTGEGFAGTDCPVCYGKGYESWLDFVVLGGETGPGARPCHPDWVRKVRDDCIAAGVDFFFKNWGGWHPAVWLTEDGDIAAIKAEHDNSEDVFGDGEYMLSVPHGRKSGRVLDGRTWDEMPED